MNDTSLYQQILGLSEPWRVTGVDLSLETGEVVVRVSTEETVWGCPECGERMHVHSRVTRRWRHLDTCQLRTVIEAEVPRVRCREHGTLTVRVPWAEPHGRFTALFEKVALLLMMKCSTSAAAEHLRLSWDEADRIKQRAVDRGLARKKASPAKAVCVDEKSVGRGHDYVTVVVRVPEDGAPFVDFVADGREKASLDAYWTLPATGPLEDIRCASMDMWRPFIDSAAAALPDGLNAVTHDPFHLVQHANKAVDEVRRKEQALLGPEKGRALKGTRFMWLYGFESLPEKWEERMKAMKDGKTRTARAWRLKEQFRAFYQCENWAQGKAFFDDWHRCAIRSRLEPVKKVAGMIRDHLPQVLNYFIHRVTNSFSEGVNGLIQELVGRARGYRNRERLKRDLYFHLGNLDMLPAVQ
jgi:transposase